MLWFHIPSLLQRKPGSAAQEPWLAVAAPDTNLACLQRCGPGSTSGVLVVLVPIAWELRQGAPQSVCPLGTPPCRLRPRQFQVASETAPHHKTNGGERLSDGSHLPSLSAVMCSIFPQSEVLINRLVNCKVVVCADVAPEVEKRFHAWTGRASCDSRPLVRHRVQNWARPPGQARSGCSFSS